MLDWDSVGKDCLPHFMNSDHGSITCDKLTRMDSGSEDKPVQHSKHDDRRILVLALDEARWLLKTAVKDRPGWFHRLWRALNRANDAIATEYGRYAGIFAILVDTNSKVSHSTPPSDRDISSRERGTDKSVLFHPFILTQTMDIILDASI